MIISFVAGIKYSRAQKFKTLMNFLSCRFCIIITGLLLLIFAKAFSFRLYLSIKHIARNKFFKNTLKFIFFQYF